MSFYQWKPLIYQLGSILVESFTLAFRKPLKIAQARWMKSCPRSNGVIFAHYLKRRCHQIKDKVRCWVIFWVNTNYFFIRDLILCETNTKWHSEMDFLLILAFQYEILQFIIKNIYLNLPIWQSRLQRSEFLVSRLNFGLGL